MRKVKYGVACSLDGYIAGPTGEADWIVADAEVDLYLGEVFGRYDTLIMGSRTFEEMVRNGQADMPGFRVCVFSVRLRQEDYPAVEIVARDPADFVRELRELPGKDIWLFGGGAMFRYLLEKGLVEGIEIGLMPVLLGKGIPLLPVTSQITHLKLMAQKAYKSGIVFLEYEVA